MGSSKNKPLPAPENETYSGSLLGCLGTSISLPEQEKSGEVSDSEAIELSTIQDSSLVANCMPISPWLWFEGRKEVLDYTVKKGDTIASIANTFGISSETILWANNLNSGSVLKQGQTLIILPVSGVLYRVQSGDSVSQIAKTYKGDAARIVAFNELTSESDISIGDILVIPDGKKSIATTPIISQIPIANNYFIRPTEGRLTQGIHFYNAVDLANKCGTPIYAAAQGQILKTAITNSTSRSANRGAGTYIKILHPNGTTTYYGHLSAVFVDVGVQVSQGQLIGLMGGQPGTPGAGNSTGCHIHFEVGGARNPFTY